MSVTRSGTFQLRTLGRSGSLDRTFKLPKPAAAMIPGLKGHPFFATGVVQLNYDGDIVEDVLEEFQKLFYQEKPLAPKTIETRCRIWVDQKGHGLRLAMIEVVGALQVLEFLEALLLKEEHFLGTLDREAFEARYDLDISYLSNDELRDVNKQCVWKKSFEGATASEHSWMCTAKKFPEVLALLFKRNNPDGTVALEISLRPLEDIFRGFLKAFIDGKPISAEGLHAKAVGFYDRIVFQADGIDWLATVAVAREAGGMCTTVHLPMDGALVERVRKALTLHHHHNTFTFVDVDAKSAKAGLPSLCKLLQAWGQLPAAAAGAAAASTVAAGSGQGTASGGTSGAAAVQPGYLKKSYKPQRVDAGAADQLGHYLRVNFEAGAPHHLAQNNYWSHTNQES